MINGSATPAATQDIVVLAGVTMVVIIVAVIGFLWVLSQ